MTKILLHTIQKTKPMIYFEHQLIFILENFNFIAWALMNHLHVTESIYTSKFNVFWIIFQNQWNKLANNSTSLLLWKFYDFTAWQHRLPAKIAQINKNYQKLSAFVCKKKNRALFLQNPFSILSLQNSRKKIITKFLYFSSHVLFFYVFSGQRRQLDPLLIFHVLRCVTRASSFIQHTHRCTRTHICTRNLFSFFSIKCTPRSLAIVHITIYAQR